MIRILKDNLILIFFILLLLFTFTSFFSFDFSGYEGEKSQKEIPDIEMSEFILNRLNSKIIEMSIEGDHVMQYKNRDVFINFRADRVSDKNAEILSGAKVIHRDDIYNFPNGITYSNDSGLHFSSRSGIYDMVKEVFYGRGEFEIKNADITTNGLDIVYDKSSGEIIAKDISARMFL